MSDGVWRIPPGLLFVLTLVWTMLLSVADGILLFFLTSCHSTPILTIAVPLPTFLILPLVSIGSHNLNLFFPFFSSDCKRHMYVSFC